MSGFNLLNLLIFVFHNPDTFYLPVPLALTLSVIIQNRIVLYARQVSVSPIIKRNQTLPVVRQSEREHTERLPSTSSYQRSVEVSYAPLELSS